MRSLTKLFNNPFKLAFATAKKKSKDAPVSAHTPHYILNDNLRFDANNHQLFMIPKHPQIKSRSMK